MKDIDKKFDTTTNKMAEHNANLEAALKQNTEQYANNLDLKLKELVDKMETKLNDLSTNITEEVPLKVNKNWNEAMEPKQEHFRHIIQEEREKQKIENEDRGFREENIIIYQAAESTDKEPDQRKHHDMTFFEELCREILEIGPIHTKQITWLGKKQTRGSGRWE